MFSESSKPPHAVLTFSIIILVNVSIHPSYAVGAQSKLASLDEKYKSGVAAYKDERWSECIKQFEETIHLNKLYNSVVGNCRLRCNELAYDPLVKDKIDDLLVYELYLRRTECLLDCQRKGFQNIQLNIDISREVAENLAALEPYNYIHMCYYRMNLLPKAASAALTYLTAHQSDATMKHNYEYYIRQPEVSEDDVVDLESDDYKVLYRQGADAYNKGLWGETVATMEEALQDYMTSENQCRVSCEGPYDQGWLPDLVTNVANHFTFVLQCKQKCQKSIVPPGFDSGIHFIADLLHHIQIGYYHLDRVNEAARAVQSYLFLLPDDKDMIGNKKIYGSLVDKDAFSERPEIVFYSKRDNYEKKLLNYVNTHFGFDGAFQSRFESFH